MDEDELNIKKLIKEMDDCIDYTISEGEFSISGIPTLHKLGDKAQSSQNYNFRSLNYVPILIIPEDYKQGTPIFRYKITI